MSQSNRTENDTISAPTVMDVLDQTTSRTMSDSLAAKEAQRETPTAARSGEQIASLNGLRAISVIIVIGSHLATSVSTPSSISGISQLFNGYLFDGALGVRMFFCISGFLITHLLLSEKDRTGKISLKTFYIRRTLRIWPVLYVFVLFLFVMSQTTALTITPCQYVTALTFTKNHGCSSWIDGHLWSLAVELQFYAIWPAVIVLCSTRTVIKLAVAAILIAPVSRLVEASADLPRWWLTSNIDTLMCGGLAAYAQKLHRALFDRILNTRPTLSRCGGFAILVTPVIVARQFPHASLQIMLGPTIQAFGATYLIASYARGPAGAIKTILNSRPLNFLGIISFSLYIWQEPFFIWPSDFGFQKLLTFEWPFNIIGMLIVATASYYCFERPLLSLRRKYNTAHGS